jgi:hypothetical protein
MMKLSMSGIFRNNKLRSRQGMFRGNRNLCGISSTVAELNKHTH